ncbi:MAG: hypothetical protein LC799_03455, partial [Actinobacteria bacterium]|nr:hypothetical protein [Actinomycetota bacterium]
DVVTLTDLDDEMPKLSSAELSALIDVRDGVAEAARVLNDQAPNCFHRDVYLAALYLVGRDGGRLAPNFPEDDGSAVVYVPQPDVNVGLRSPFDVIPADEQASAWQACAGAGVRGLDSLTVEATLRPSMAPTATPFILASGDPLVALALATQQPRPGAVASIRKILVSELTELTAGLVEVRQAVAGGPWPDRAALVLLHERCPGLIEQYPGLALFFHQHARLRFDDPVVGITPHAWLLSSCDGDDPSATEPTFKELIELPVRVSTGEAYAAIARKQALISYYDDVRAADRDLPDELASHLAAAAVLHEHVVKDLGSSEVSIFHLYHDVAPIAGRRAANNAPVDMVAMAHGYPWYTGAVDIARRIARPARDEDPYTPAPSS